MNDYRYFKLSHDVVIDMYTFKKEEWYSLGGDFLAPHHANSKGLELVLNEELSMYESNPSLDELKIEYK